ALRPFVGGCSTTGVWSLSLHDALPISCGRGLPLLREIQGRSTDFVVAQDGTVMHGLALIYILRDMPQIRAFKIIQETLDLTRILDRKSTRLNSSLVKISYAVFCLKKKT